MIPITKYGGNVSLLYLQHWQKLERGRDKVSAILLMLSFRFMYFCMIH